MIQAPGTARLHLVVSGHVDHGKSTLIGRLLADTGSLPAGKLDEVRALCARTSKPFEYAFLLDALKDERAQGITIDAARVHFSTATRQYGIIDAPGHIEFLRNLVTGAARAEAALLVIDAHEGVQENSRRHATLLSMLGIRHVAVVVNKMDLVAHDRATFDAVVASFRAFLGRLGVSARAWIPASARTGANVITRSADMPWFDGPTVLEALEAFPAEPPPDDRPFRMPVQDVYKFTNFGDDRRIVAGTVASGRAGVGDELVFYPSGKRAHIRSIEAFSSPPRTSTRAGEATGFTLAPQVYTTRGELAARSDEASPHVTSRLRVNLFWLGQTPLALDREYVFRLGPARVPMRIEAIHRVIDAADLDDTGQRTHVDRNQVAECTLALQRAIAFDLAADLAPTGRFVIVDDHDIRGGGLVADALPDRKEWVRDKVLVRNAKWTSSHVSLEQRAERYGQEPRLLLVTGEAAVDRKELARQLEVRLFEQGRLVYFLGMANVLYGVDADIARGHAERREHFRRLAEIANLLLDAGMILIVSAAEVTQADLDVLQTGLPPSLVRVAWIGAQVTTDLTCDLVLSEADVARDGIEAIETLLSDGQRREADGTAARPAGQALAEPAVVWFTGLPGAGKTTIARAVHNRLAHLGTPVELLDGDDIRALFPGTGFTREARDAHIRRVGHLASRLEHHGVTCLVSLVSPYRESRDFVRRLCRRFVEVYVSTPLEECERRDPKGLYKEARAGERAQMTGVADPYEPPGAAELIIDTRVVSVDAAADIILRYLMRLPADRRPPR